MRLAIAVANGLTLVACTGKDIANPLRRAPDRSATILPGSEVIDLGTLGGALSAAWGVNAAGKVVGLSYLPGSTDALAFVWQHGIMTALEALPTRESPFSVAYSINYSGQIAGYAKTGRNNFHAVLWDAGRIQDLGALGGDSAFSIAFRLNDAGQVVGSSVTTSGTSHGFVWQQGTMQDLGTLPGGVSSEAISINAAGQIVGYSQSPPYVIHAVLWKDGIIHDLGTLGGDFSVARDINDAGQVVGESTTASGATHAFLWEAGTMRDLGAFGHVDFSEAHVINEFGQVSGEGGDGTGRTFFWSQSDGMEDLSATTGLRGAFGIHGLKIVGYLPNLHAGLVNLNFTPSQP